mmetsp:Transcript_23773/g.57624  ORF Transcript_23773/g.57624 Transcript_23773/m.57624 type:complete len:197 (+) Transcript_23773:231-821(+)
MWSLGVIIYELMSGISQFERRRTLPEFFNHVRKTRIKFPPQYWEGTSKEVQQLILGLMEKEQKKRLSAEEVVHHSWVAKHCEEYEQSIVSRNTASLSRSSNPRGKHLKLMYGKDKFQRAVMFIMLIARMRDCADTLIKETIGERIGVSVKTIIKQMNTTASETGLGPEVDISDSSIQKEDFLKQPAYEHEISNQTI